MAAISFGNIETTDQRLDVDATVTGDDGDETVHHLWFESDQPLTWDPDNIALALATLCGRAYRKIDIDLPMWQETATAISDYAHAQVGILRERDGQRPARPEGGYTLNFSGGFDSLAALSLMPENTRLVSLDFGGRFSRERDYYQRYNPTIIATNLVETPFRANSWAFMGIAALLTAADQPSRYMSFGTILEAGIDNLRLHPNAARGETFPLFAAAGFTNAPYVGGLTEVGTIIALGRLNPAVMGDSLVSLASPGEEKLYRKWVLTQVVADRANLTLDVPAIPPRTTPHFTWGQNFATDFLSLYVYKYAGPEVRDTMLLEAPESVDRVVDDLSLEFFEKANTTMYRAMPAGLIGGVVEKLRAAGIDFYSETDWAEYTRIREIMAPYYPALTV